MASALTVLCLFSAVASFGPLLGADAVDSGSSTSLAKAKAEAVGRLSGDALRLARALRREITQVPVIDGAPRDDILIVEQPRMQLPPALVEAARNRLQQEISRIELERSKEHDDDEDEQFDGQKSLMADFLRDYARQAPPTVLLMPQRAQDEMQMPSLGKALEVPVPRSLPLQEMIQEMMMATGKPLAQLEVDPLPVEEPLRPRRRKALLRRADDDVVIALPPANDEADKGLAAVSGAWTNQEGDKAQIADGMVTWSDGYVSPMRWLDHSTLAIIRGREHHAELRDGKLLWDNGDIWSQLGAKRPDAVAAPDAKPQRDSSQKDSEVSKTSDEKQEHDGDEKVDSDADAQVSQQKPRIPAEEIKPPQAPAKAEGSKTQDETDDTDSVVKSVHNMLSEMRVIHKKLGPRALKDILDEIMAKEMPVGSANNTTDANAIAPVANEEQTALDTQTGADVPVVKPQASVAQTVMERNRHCRGDDCETLTSVDGLLHQAQASTVPMASVPEPSFASQRVAIGSDAVRREATP